MAVTPFTMVVGSSSQIVSYWAASIYSSNVTAGEVIKAAPASGNLYLEAITVISDADCWLYDDTNLLVGQWEITSTETKGQYSIKFKRPIKITGDLKIDQTVGAPVCVVAQGYIA